MPDDNKLKPQLSGKGKSFVGVVVSVAMKQTVVVAVTHLYRHPIYKKAIKRTKKFAAHNASLSLAKGDTVRIAETKPMSKTKYFVVTDRFSTRVKTKS